jgi:hypothetical protein
MIPQTASAGSIVPRAAAAQTSTVRRNPLRCEHPEHAQLERQAAEQVQGRPGRDDGKLVGPKVAPGVGDAQSAVALTPE